MEITLLLHPRSMIVTKKGETISTLFQYDPSNMPTILDSLNTPDRLPPLQLVVDVNFEDVERL